MLCIPSFGLYMILENCENNLRCFVRSSYSCLGSLPTFPFILLLFHCQLSTNLPHLFYPSLLDTHTSTAKWALLRGSGACKATLARAHLCQTNQHTWFTYHRTRASLTTLRTRQKRMRTTLSELGRGGKGRNKQQKKASDKSRRKWRDEVHQHFLNEFLPNKIAKHIDIRFIVKCQWVLRR